MKRRAVTMLTCACLLLGATSATATQAPAPATMVDRTAAAADPVERRVRVAHISMQFSDSAEQMQSDADKVFRREKNRGTWWVTGTEAGSTKARDALRTAADDHGFRFVVKRSVWVAVRKSRIAPNSFASGWVQVIPHKSGTYSDRGIAWVRFRNRHLGVITVGASHYLTRGRQPGDPNYQRNTRLADAIGTWAGNRGDGNKLVFYGGDQNILDAPNDTFRGNPLTSTWDERERWESTGHGCIDVIASYDPDTRVRAHSVNALNDGEFHLHTDHFLVESTFKVTELND